MADNRGTLAEASRNALKCDPRQAAVHCGPPRLDAVPAPAGRDAGPRAGLNALTCLRLPLNSDLRKLESASSPSKNTNHESKIEPGS
jgi:hypothetical protein